MLQGREKNISRRKVGRGNQGIDPLYFHNWTVVFLLLVTFLFIPYLLSLELSATICLVSVLFLSTLTLDTSYLYSLICFCFLRFDTWLGIVHSEIWAFIVITWRS